MIGRQVSLPFLRHVLIEPPAPSFACPNCGSRKTKMVQPLDLSRPYLDCDGCSTMFGVKFAKMVTGKTP